MEDIQTPETVSQYRLMTSDQKAAWGRAELETRKRDLVEHGVAAAEHTAETRRLAIGISHRAATALVTLAVRQNRREEAERQRAAPLVPVFVTAQPADLAVFGRLAVATEQSPKGPQYERDLTAQQQALANVGLLEGWK